MSTQARIYLDIDGVLNSPSGTHPVIIGHNEDGSPRTVRTHPQVIEAFASLDQVSFCSVWRDKTPIFANAAGLPEWDWLDFEIEWALRADAFRTQVIASKVGAILADMSTRKIKRAVFVDDWARFLPFGILERARRRGLEIITTDGHVGLDLERAHDIIEALEIKK